MPTIWISAGEISGDLHGALLAHAIHALRPEIHLMGMAGPAMRAAGVEAKLTTESLSVMGLTEVLAQAGRILRLLRRTHSELAAQRPDLVVVIDAPDYHFRILRMAKRLGIPALYYISPKLWAWREKRALFLKNHTRRILSILPFEPQFYARFGMAVDYVGHPLLDLVRTPAILARHPHEDRVALLPGSRKREIHALLPLLCRTATLLARRHPRLEFVLPVAPSMDEGLIHRLWTQGPPVHLVPAAQRYPAIRSCCLALAASGTVTLETALLEVPTLVTYRFSPITYAVGKHMVRVPWISLPNLILDHEVFPEFLQDAATPDALAAWASWWLENPQARADVVQALGDLPNILGGGGAVQRAAAIVLHELAGPK
jgi:lipid-A-disaccharide synthase